MYLKNLDADYLTDTKLRELFSAYGPISSIDIPTTPENTAVGYAFVNFQSFQMAERVVAEIINKDIDGRALHVDRAQKRSERTEILRSEQQGKRQGRKLYVKHLAPELDETGLENHFARYGTIERCPIVRERSGAFPSLLHQTRPRQ